MSDNTNETSAPPQHKWISIVTHSGWPVIFLKLGNIGSGYAFLNQSWLFVGLNTLDAEIWIIKSFTLLGLLPSRENYLVLFWLHLVFLGHILWLVTHHRLFKTRGSEHVYRWGQSSQNSEYWAICWWGIICMFTPGFIILGMLSGYVTLI